MNEEMLDTAIDTDETSVETEVLEDSIPLGTDEKIEESEMLETSDAQDSDEDLKKERDALLSEIEGLRAELENRSKSRERYLSEFREFSEIFGKDTLDAVPQSVWDRVEEGVPLAAAYALYEKKNALLLEKADSVNKKNASMTTGAINNASVSGFFSPSEVRGMSAKEVKKNYDLIIESMKKWN